MNRTLSVSSISTVSTGMVAAPMGYEGIDRQGCGDIGSIVGMVERAKLVQHDRID